MVTGKRLSPAEAALRTWAAKEKACFDHWRTEIITRVLNA